MNVVQTGGVDDGKAAGEEGGPQGAADRGRNGAYCRAGPEGFARPRHRGARGARALGGLYTVFDDLDGLVLHVNSDTLKRLETALNAALPPSGDLEESFLSLSLAYLRFALAERNLWSALFEHRMPEGVAVPDWHLAEHAFLIGLIAAPPCAPDAGRFQARSHRPQPSGYGLLQASDAADDLGPLSGGGRDLLAHQPHDDRCGSPTKSTRANCARSSIMPARCVSTKKELIWLAATVSMAGRRFSAGVHRLARRLPPAGIRAAQGRRPVRAAFRRPVDAHDHVGNPGARNHQRAVRARR
jgi:hypothetical protein